MPNEDLSKRQFQKKISAYCDVRIVSVAPDRVVDNVRAYLLALITFRKTPALANNRYDWRQIAHDCGIDEALTITLKKQLRPALDAIMRWLKEPLVEDDAPKSRRLQAAPISGATGKFTPSPTSQHHEIEEIESSPSPGRPALSRDQFLTNQNPCSRPTKTRVHSPMHSPIKCTALVRVTGNSTGRSFA